MAKHTEEREVERRTVEDDRGQRYGRPGEEGDRYRRYGRSEDPRGDPYPRSGYDPRPGYGDDPYSRYDDRFDRERSSSRRARRGCGDAGSELISGSCRVLSDLFLDLSDSWSRPRAVTNRDRFDDRSGRGCADDPAAVGEAVCASVGRGVSRYARTWERAADQFTDSIASDERADFEDESRRPRASRPTSEGPEGTEESEAIEVKSKKTIETKTEK